jgi:hypothetical protein
MFQYNFVLLRHNQGISYMARVGYIMSFKHLEEDLKADIQWMNDHGCCTIYIEDERNEKHRFEWKGYARAAYLWR